MNDWFLLVLSLSVSGSLLALLILALNLLWRKRLSATWQYYIYLLVIARLLIPFHTDVNLVGRIFDGAWEWMSVSRQDEPDSVPDGNEDTTRDGWLYDKTEADAEASAAEQYGQDNPWEDRRGADSRQQTGRLAGMGPAANARSRAAGMLWLVWVLPGVFFFIRKAAAYRSFLRRMKLGCRRVKEEKILDLYQIICLDLRIKRPPKLFRNEEAPTPMLAGVFRPFIMLPGSDGGISEVDRIEGDRMKNDRIERERTEGDRAYGDQMERNQREEEQLRHILRHELVHRKRSDIFYKWLVQFTVCVHWFNPLVYLIRREIDRLCELSCDESLLKGFGEGERLRYGDTLLSAVKVQKSGVDAIVPLTWNNDKKMIKERLDAIMRYHKKSKTGKMLTSLLTVALLSAAAVTGTYAAEGASAEKGEVPSAVLTAREFLSGKTAKSTQEPSARNSGSVMTLESDVFREVIDREEGEQAAQVESYTFRVTETGKKILLRADVTGDGRRTLELFSPDGSKVRSYTFSESGFSEGSAEYVDGGAKLKKLMATGVAEPGLWRMQIRTEEGETGKFTLEAKLFEPEIVSFVTDEPTQDSEKKEDGGEDDVKPDTDNAQYGGTYDSYRTYEEARSDMEEGYVYYMNKSFSEELSPLLINDRRISFQVHHENMLDISIRLENLRRAKRSGIWKPFTDKAFVRFELYNPDGEIVSSFYKEEEELEEAVDLSAEIPVYPGEWSYKIEFAYATDGVNTSNLTVTMKYRDLYEDDVEWLFENKLRR